jgi:hypothetical protein
MAILDCRVAALFVAALVVVLARRRLFGPIQV